MHLVEVFALGLRHAADDEAESREGDCRVEPEGPVEAQSLLEVHERLDADEGAHVAEGRRDGASQLAVLQRKQLAWIGGNRT